MTTAQVQPTTHDRSTHAHAHFSAEARKRLSTQIGSVPVPTLVVYGSYSIERLLALEDYSRTKSYAHVMWAMVWTPLLPILLILAYQLPPLAPPETGLLENWMYVVERSGIGVFALFDSGLVILGILVPELVPVMPLRKRLALSGLSTAAYVVALILLARVWGFPVPFTTTILGPVATSVVNISIYVMARPILTTNSKVRQRIFTIFSYTGVVCFCGLVYPAYMALFVAVGEHSPQYQPLVSLLAPLLKLTLRKLLAYAVRAWEDLIPLTIIFSVELFGSLYQAISVQSSRSMFTTAFIIAIDLISTAKSQWTLHQRTRSLHKLLRSAPSEALLPVVDAYCEDTARLQACPVDEVRQLGEIRLYSDVGNDHVSDASRSRLERIDRAKVFASSSRRSKRAMTLRAVVAKLSLLKHAVTPVDLLASRSPSGHLVPSEKPCTVISEATEMLFRTEMSLLTEYLECIVPMFYAANLVVMWLSPNAPYYPQAAAIETPAELGLALRNIFVLLALEVASFVLLNVTLWKRLRFSPLHQVAYVLEHHSTYVRATMMIALIQVAIINLTHSGTDFSFQFKWLRPHITP